MGFSYRPPGKSAGQRFSSSGKVESLYARAVECPTCRLPWPESTPVGAHSESFAELKNRVVFCCSLRGVHVESVLGSIQIEMPDAGSRLRFRSLWIGVDRKVGLSHAHCEAITFEIRRAAGKAQVQQT